MFLQTTAGHNRGPPQRTYYLGSILLMKKLKNNLKTKNIKQIEKHEIKKLIKKKEKHEKK